MSAPESFRAAFARLPWLARANVLALACGGLLLCLLLWPAWKANPDLSHGFFLPVLFLLLLIEGRSAGAQRFIGSGRRSAFATAVLAAAGLAVLFFGGLYAAVLDWSNALVIFAMTGAFVLLMAAALAAFSDARTRLFPLNWTACTAIVLWILSSPIPPGTYSRITMALQLGITADVIGALHLLGVPAFHAGNVIELANGAVGVEEACSGIRSLISCVFAGLFFSASLIRRPPARTVLLLLSPILALGMNFLRSLFLTLLASSGVAIEGAWHDITGVAALVLTVLLLGGIALWLGRGGDDRISAPGASAHPQGAGMDSGTSAEFRQARFSRPAAQTGKARGPVTGAQKFLAAGLLAATGLVALFYLNTRPASSSSALVPDLWTALPDLPAGWRVSAASDLRQYKDTLRTDLLAQRTYRNENVPGEEIILYLAYWRPDQAPVSLVASHTPDACWPGTGWAPQFVPETRTVLSVAGQALPPAEARLFTNKNAVQYVWFWHIYDGKPIAYVDPYSFRRLLSIAWRYGFRHGGDQLFVRVSSTRPWPKIASEPLLADFFAHLRPLGL